jgi:hypothetical protein
MVLSIKGYPVVGRLVLEVHATSAFIILHGVMFQKIVNLIWGVVFNLEPRQR